MSRGYYLRCYIVTLTDSYWGFKPLPYTTQYYFVIHVGIIGIDNTRTCKLVCKTYYTVKNNRERNVRCNVDDKC